MFGARVVVVDVSEHYTSPPTLPTNHKGSDAMSRNHAAENYIPHQGRLRRGRPPAPVGKRKGLREFILYENTQHSSPKPLARSALAASFMTILPSASSRAGASQMQIVYINMPYGRTYGSFITQNSVHTPIRHYR